MLKDLFEEEGFAGLSGSSDENSGGMAKGDHDCAVEYDGVRWVSVCNSERGCE